MKLKFKFKILSKRSLLIVGVAAMVCSVGIIAFRESGVPVLPALHILGQARPGLPIRLKIPKIGVDAAFEYLGVTRDGAMAVPKGPADVAWFNLGPRPGENGSAVIAGHEGWVNGISAVFDDLNKLKKGDEIVVEDEKGATVTFIVREVRTYDQNGDASKVFDSSDGKAHLNLITCEGIWNAAQQSYANRLVVFADLE